MKLFILTSLCFAGLFFQVQAHTLPTEVNFQSVTRLGQQIWVSGTQGSVFCSADNGKQWQSLTKPPGGEALQFRDLARVGDSGLVAMSAGEGKDSRLYHSTDDGKSWTLVLQGTGKSFFDCIDFSDEKNGWMYGDSDDLGLSLYHSTDGGAQWQRQAIEVVAQPSEGGFASSGTCIVAQADGQVFAATGNGPNPRLLWRQSNGLWRSIASPFRGGEAAGIFSLTLDKEYLYVLGGSLKDAEQPAVAYRFDIVKNNWDPLPNVPLNGAIYGSAIDSRGLYISNPDGIARWNGNKWDMLSGKNTWAVACDEQFGCIGVGAEGSISRF